MLWFLLSLGAAVFDSARDQLNKVGLKHLDEYTVGFGYRFVGFLLLLPIALYFGVPSLGQNFWPAVAGATLSNLVSTIMILKAIKLSPLSLTAPMLAFTPAFLLVTSPIMLHEYPSTLGILGVLLIVAGAYMLNLSKKSKGLLEPFRAIRREPGSFLMLIVAFIFGIAANIDKIGVLSSTPVFYTATVWGALSLALLPFALIKGKGLHTLVKKPEYTVAAGVVSGVMILMQNTAITLTQVPYVNSVKRTSILFSTIGGKVFFDEKNFRERFTGAAIMVAGVALIALGG